MKRPHDDVVRASGTVQALGVRCALVEAGAHASPRRWRGLLHRGDVRVAVEVTFRGSLGPWGLEHVGILFLAIGETWAEASDDADRRLAQHRAAIGLLGQSTPAELSVSAAMPALGDLLSECCSARITASLGDGVLIGTCDSCDRYVCRRNPRTRRAEWLDGESPWSLRDDLRQFAAAEPAR